MNCPKLVNQYPLQISNVQYKNPLLPTLRVILSGCSANRQRLLAKSKLANVHWKRISADALKVQEKHRCGRHQFDKGIHRNRKRFGVLALCNRDSWIRRLSVILGVFSPCHVHLSYKQQRYLIPHICTYCDPFSLKKKNNTMTVDRERNTQESVAIFECLYRILYSYTFVRSCCKIFKNPFTY